MNFNTKVGDDVKSQKRADTLTIITILRTRETTAEKTTTGYLLSDKNETEINVCITCIWWN